MASRLPGTGVGWAAQARRRTAAEVLHALTFRDARARVLAVVVGAIVLLHRDGLAGPKAVYLAAVAAAAAAALPVANGLRGDRARISEARLVGAAAVVGLMMVLSLPVALAHGTGVVAWVRDASAYGLLAAVPLLALDLRRSAGPRWVIWLLLATGITCTASFVVEWLALREYVVLPIDSILLPSFYLPAGLLAYATARGIRARASEALAWWLVAGAIAGGLAVTGTRTTLIVLAAPVAQLALPGRRRTLAVALTGAALAVVLAFAAADAVGVDSRGTSGRLTSIGTFLRHPNSDPSWRQRIEEGKDALDAWRESPVVGVGPGHLFRWHDFRGFPHSSFLIDSPAGYLAKFGVVGVIVLAVFAAAMALFVRRRLRARADETGPGTEALLGLCTITVCGLVLGVPMEDKGFPLAVLLLTALALPGRPDPIVSAGRLRRNAVAVAALVVLASATAAAVGRSSSSTSVALRELPSILNGQTPPLRVVGSFEYALWAGDGKRACALLTSTRRARYRSTDRCIRLLSRRGRGDPQFARSRAIGPIGPTHGPVLRFRVRRRTGAEASYVLRTVAGGRWRISDFGEVGRPSLSSTPRALRPSIVNAHTPPVRMISRFEYALWAGDGKRACFLLTPARRSRYGTTERCVQRLSRFGRGDPQFARSRALGPLGGGRGSVLRYLVRRRDGRAAAYTMRELRRATWTIWRIDAFRDLGRTRGSP
jgi:hypothetical protein